MITITILYFIRRYRSQKKIKQLAILAAAQPAIA